MDTDPDHGEPPPSVTGVGLAMIQTPISSRGVARLPPCLVPRDFSLVEGVVLCRSGVLPRIYERGEHFPGGCYPYMAHSYGITLSVRPGTARGLSFMEKHPLTVSRVRRAELECHDLLESHDGPLPCMVTHSRYTEDLLSCDDLTLRELNCIYACGRHVYKEGGLFVSKLVAYTLVSGMPMSTEHERMYGSGNAGESVLRFMNLSERDSYVRSQLDPIYSDGNVGCVEYLAFHLDPDVFPYDVEYSVTQEDRMHAVVFMLGIARQWFDLRRVAEEFGDHVMAE